MSKCGILPMGSYLSPWPRPSSDTQDHTLTFRPNECSSGYYHGSDCHVGWLWDHLLLQSIASNSHAFGYAILPRLVMAPLNMCASKSSSVPYPKTNDTTPLVVGIILCVGGFFGTMQDNTASLSGFALFANGVAVSVSFKALNAEGLIRRITSSAANPVLPKER